MDERAELELEFEAIVAYYAQGAAADDDGLFQRIFVTVRRNPSLALQIGTTFLESPAAARREIGVRLIGCAGVQENYARRDSAARVLRRALAIEYDADALGAAIVQLGYLDDVASHDPILEHARHPDTGVRFAVAVALPSVGFDEAVLVALLELMRDEDDDVRDWATFGVGALSDFDDERIRVALLDRLADTNLDARLEAIVGLARRQDERVRAPLAAELARPEHAEMCDHALEYLDLGPAAEVSSPHWTDRPEGGWRTPGS